MGLTTGGNKTGCHDGDDSYLPSVLVMFVRLLPSGFITKRSPLPKMIFVPSGDHAEVPGQILSVRSVGLEPSALTTQRCSVEQPAKQPVPLVKVIFEPSGDHAGS